MCANLKTHFGNKELKEKSLLVKNSDVIFIATTPNRVEDVLNEGKNELTSDKLLVSDILCFIS